MENVGGTSLHAGDIAVIVIYFAFILFVGLWTSRKNRGSAGGYFLAGRNMNWIPVGASLFASNIGSIHFVGLAGSGAASGIAIGLYELNAMYVLMILCYIFLPVYIASGVFTMPEYLKRRFGGKRIQIYLAILALLVYIFTKISADLYAGAIFIEQSLKWNIYGSIMLLLSVAAIFTITGGLTAVIWTDFIQTIIMLIGGVALMVLAFLKVGGFQGMVDKYPMAIPNTTLYGNSTCGIPREDYMHLLRDPVKGDLPWPGLVGVTINSIWYWCSDQVIVQRALAGKTYDHAKAGTILCGYLKILPLFLIVFPGMIARILYTDTVGCADPDICREVCGSEAGCTNIAYPTLVLNLMPAGARGMMLAVMLSALMSSLTSIFNSSSTIFAMDVWCYVRKQASEMEIMIVGRLFVLLLVVVSIIWVPVLRLSQGSDLYVYIQQVSSFLQPPICCIFLMALFWPRLNEQGAFWGLVLGMVTGLVRFGVEYSYDVPRCDEDRPDPTPGIIKNFHYLYFSVFLFMVTGLSAIFITLLTKPINPKCQQRLTFWTRYSKERCEDIDNYRPEMTINDMESSKQVELVTLKELTSVQSKNEDESLTKEESLMLTTTEEMKDSHLDTPTVVIEDYLPTPGSFPWYRKVCNWICGLDNMDKGDLAYHKVKHEQMINIDQNPIAKKVTNVAAILLMAIVIFFVVYFR